MLEQTLTSNNKVRLDPQYPVVAGVDDERVPQLLKVKSDGTIDLGGVTLPVWDTFATAYYGSTNNVHTVIYTLSGNEVARWTFTYRNGAAADDDDIATGVFLIP
jgi:hypothetical protein